MASANDQALKSDPDLKENVKKTDSLTEPAHLSWLFAPDEHTRQRSRDRKATLKLLKAKAARTSFKDEAPPSLIDKVEDFLQRYHFTSTHRLFVLERSAMRQVNGGASTTANNPSSTSLPGLVEIYEKWSADREQEPHSDVTSSGNEDEPDASDDASNDASDQSSDSQSQSDSESESGSESKSNSSASTSASAERLDSKAVAAMTKAGGASSNTSASASSSSDSESGTEVTGESASDHESSGSSEASSSDSQASEVSSSDSEEEASSEEGDDGPSAKAGSQPIATGVVVKVENKPPKARKGSDSSATLIATSPTKKIAVKASPSSTGSGSTTDSDDSPSPNEPAGQSNTTVRKRKLDSAVECSHDANTKKARKGPNAPFQRIPSDTLVDPGLGSNAYVPYDYAERAHRDLIVTKGRGFTKEKNKKKRGS